MDFVHSQGFRICCLAYSRFMYCFLDLNQHFESWLYLKQFLRAARTVLSDSMVTYSK